MPHCTPRLSHPSVGGNTRGLEMAWPTRPVGAGLRGLLGPTAHGWVRLGFEVSRFPDFCEGGLGIC